MENENLVIGRRSVMELLKSGNSVEKVFIQEGYHQHRLQEVLDYVKENKVTTKTVPKAKLDLLSEGKSHQGIAAVASTHEYVELSDLFNVSKEKNEQPFFLILDEIEDPHNLGAIIRTADGAGVHGVIIPRRRSVGLTPTVTKVASGATQYVPVCRVTNLSQLIDELKEAGVWLVGTDSKSSNNYTNIDSSIPIALVIGNESRGIRSKLKEKCDFLVNIPMKGSLDSLNASVAAGLMMYQVTNSRENDV